jgi:hypothetical protein
MGAFRGRVAARRGRNIGVVAAAREQLGLVFYGLRDPRGPRPARGVSRGHRSARVAQVMTPVDGVVALSD